METISAEVKAPPATPYVLALRQGLAEEGGRRVTGFDFGELTVEVRAMHDSLWAIVRRAGQGGLAVRAAFLAAPFGWKVAKAGPNEAARITLDSPLGEHVVTFATSSDELERLRITVRFTPVTPMLVPFSRAISIRWMRRTTRSVPRGSSRRSSAGSTPASSISGSIGRRSATCSIFRT